MVYSAKDSAKLDINKSQIVDKIAFERIASASLFQATFKKIVPSLTLIITGMKVRLLF
jgi:hypothetical protein